MDNTIKYHDYIGSVEYSADDECFYGRVLGLNDLVTFEGTSVKELKNAFRDAIEDYLEICSRQGKEPEKPYKGSFNIRINPALHRQAAQYAAAQGLTLNKFVEQAIEQYVHHT